MIYLNLISPQQQRLIKIKTIYYYIENFLGLLVFALIILTTILIPINGTLNSLNRLILDSEKINETKGSAINLKIYDFNKSVLILDKIEATKYDWLNFMQKISQAAPANISLNKITAKLTDHQFEITGFADTRDGFIAFKNNLVNTNIFYNLNSPISEILIKDNIDFDLKGLFK